MVEHELLVSEVEASLLAKKFDHSLQAFPEVRTRLHTQNLVAVNCVGAFTQIDVFQTGQRRLDIRGFESFEFLCAI